MLSHIIRKSLIIQHLFVLNHETPAKRLLARVSFISSSLVLSITSQPLPKKTSLAARASQTCPNLEELRSNCMHLGINYSITNLKSGYIMLYWSIIIGIIILTNHHSSEVAVRSLQFIWVNYNISLTWIKAIWGWFPLLTMIPVRSQWGRYNLPRIYPA